MEIRGLCIGRLIGFLATLLLAVVALGQPVLAGVVAPAEQCCSVAPNGARLAGETSDVLLNSSRQLQSKFKHASDFGVQGNYNRANASRFSEALNQHVNSPLTTAIEGTYRGNPVTHHLDPATGLNVIADSGGNFVSGWKLGAEQLQNVLTHGGLN